VRVALLLGFTAAGCAYRPVVDPKRTDMAKYETDLVECRQVAEQGPGGGAVLGAAGGAGAGEKNKRQIVKNCMTQRGHAVLD